MYESVSSGMKSNIASGPLRAIQQGLKIHGPYGRGNSGAILGQVSWCVRRHGEARRSSYQTENLKKVPKRAKKKKRLVPKRTLY